MTREELEVSWSEMWGKSAALNNRWACWSEEVVSSELRERLDRWLAAAGGGEIREVERREKKKKKSPESKLAEMTRNSPKHPK
jgi:hypothetical protein